MDEKRLNSVQEEQEGNIPNRFRAGLGSLGLGNIKMTPKLIALFLLVGLIPLAVVAVFSMMRPQDALMFIQQKVKEERNVYVV
jgi:hypothetical protein